MRDVILDVQAGDKPTEATAHLRNFVYALPKVSGVFDATSVKATEANKPRVTKAIIDKYIPETDAKLVIALGHGGILSSAATYSAMYGESSFYAVRFSRHKGHDYEPALAGNEKEVLRDLAKDRAVIVHDEDRGLWGGGTIRTAAEYFNELLGVSTYGVTPVLARHPSSMWPQVIKVEDAFRSSCDTFDTWSDEMKAIIKDQEQE